MKMHSSRLFSAVIASLVLLQPATVLALPGGPTLAAQSPTGTVAVNGQFTVPVYMDTRTYAVTTAQLHLTYPAGSLQVVSIQPGTMLPNIVTAGATGNGTASITVGSGTSPAQGTGTIALVTFRALTAGAAQISFATTTQVEAVGQIGNVVDTMTPVTVTVLSAVGGTPTPSSLLGGVGTVSTGPMETGLIALIVGAIAVLAYAGYASTEEFRRTEAQSIAESERTHPPDMNR